MGQSRGERRKSDGQRRNAADDEEKQRCHCSTRYRPAIPHRNLPDALCRGTYTNPRTADSFGVRVVARVKGMVLM
ncbi:hypothetical protein GCM10027033_25770 [Leucobacter ruminantium]